MPSSGFWRQPATPTWRRMSSTVPGATPSPKTKLCVATSGFSGQPASFPCSLSATTGHSESPSDRRPATRNPWRLAQSIRMMKSPVSAPADRRRGGRSSQKSWPPAPAFGLLSRAVAGRPGTARRWQRPTCRVLWRCYCRPIRASHRPRSKRFLRPLRHRSATRRRTMTPAGAWWMRIGPLPA